MMTSTFQPPSSSSMVFDGFIPSTVHTQVPRADNLAVLERTADYVLDDCLFALGQAVGTRKTIDYDAIVWVRDHFRAKFLGALQAFGNRWVDDRENVTGAAFMLAERAVRYAGDAQ